MVYSMALDWLASNVYIMDSGLKRLVVCSISRPSCGSIDIPSAGTLGSIVLNPYEGQVTLLLELA